MTWIDTFRVITVGTKNGVTAVVIGLDSCDEPDDCCRAGEIVLSNDVCQMELPNRFPVGHTLRVED